jgi:hypothetical protein
MPRKRTTDPSVNGPAEGSGGSSPAPEKPRARRAKTAVSTPRLASATPAARKPRVKKVKDPLAPDPSAAPAVLSSVAAECADAPGAAAVAPAGAAETRSISNLASAVGQSNAGNGLDQVSHEDIARLAYSFWEARGFHGGSAEEDWYRAEMLLRGRVRRTLNGN